MVREYGKFSKKHIEPCRNRSYYSSMKSALVPLLLLLGSSAQTPEPHVFFREGTFESLVNSCRKVDTIHDGIIPAENQAGAGLCLGFINGVVDGIMLSDATRAGGSLKRMQSTLCVPETASGAQLAKVVVKFGDNHPEELHQPAAFEVAMALKTAFRCD
jgi:Rap1a immunity proteins